MISPYVLYISEDGKVSILKLSDNSYVKSQGTILEFDSKEKASKVLEYLTEQISLINEASRIWYSREKDEDECYVLRRFVMEE